MKTAFTDNIRNVTKSVSGAVAQMASLLWRCFFYEINKVFTAVPDLETDFPLTTGICKDEANLSGDYAIGLRGVSTI